MDNNKWGWKQGKEVGRAGGVGKAGRIRQKTVLEQQKMFKNLKNERKKAVPFSVF